MTAALFTLAMSEELTEEDDNVGFLNLETIREHSECGDNGENNILLSPRVNAVSEDAVVLNIGEQ